MEALSVKSRVMLSTAKYIASKIPIFDLALHIKDDLDQEYFKYFVHETFSEIAEEFEELAEKMTEFVSKEDIIRLILYFMEKHKIESEEKNRELLRACLRGCIKTSDPDKFYLFRRFCEELDWRHIRLLDVSKEYGYCAATWKFQDKHERSVLWNDLYARGLVFCDTKHAEDHGRSKLPPLPNVTTEGRKLLEFIECDNLWESEDE